MNQPFIKEEQIRFQHVDYAGIVFYPRYFEMLNCIVEDFYDEALGLPFNKMHETGGIPTVDLKVQFMKPARLGEVLTKYFLDQEYRRFIAIVRIQI
jgi:4-hydroxybenzoyl-CoA thioesterase